MKSTLVQYNSWHTGPGIDEQARRVYWPKEGEELGDGSTERSSALGNGGQSEISLTPDVDETKIFASFKVHNLKVCM